MGRLDDLDLTLKLSRKEQDARLEVAQQRLAHLRLTLGGQTGPEGSDGPLPGRGGMAIYDRTWYGRVLVERVEGITPEVDWRRGYQEIREFERQLTDDGTILVKFWLHVSDQEQLERFERRKNDPLKSWKLTEEDWRNRAKRDDYTAAVEEMVAETDSGHAPWDLIPADSKRWARVAVIETVIRRIEERCEELGFALPAARATDDEEADEG